MSKSVADNTKRIATSFLKKHGYFAGWRSGIITWTHGWSYNKSSVGIEVSTLHEEDMYLRIHYTQTDPYSEEKSDFDYKIPLTNTPCRYGGKRYWFVCPWYKNGVYCGKRVGVLYKDGDYFACRHCYDLTYESRNISGFMKAFGKIISIPELEEEETQIKKTHYRGKPTKRYERHLKRREKNELTLLASLSMLDKRFQKTRDLVTRIKKEGKV